MFFYLIRHGETEYNNGGRVQGHRDIPLSALGLRQAEALAERLSRERCDALYSSDLLRASQTADAVARRCGIEKRPNSLLRERCFGVLEGLRREQIHEQYPEVVGKLLADPDGAPPEGESKSDVHRRCREFVDSARAKHGVDDKILVVAHGGSVMAILAILCDWPGLAGMVRLGNTSLSIVEVGEKTTIQVINDTCHLNSIGVTTADADTSTH
jgi:2,3-bisphosphoglycerate-dependent phosphoglycerate mutase